MTIATLGVALSGSARADGPTLQAFPVPASVASPTGFNEGGLIEGPNGQEWFVTTAPNGYVLAEVDTAGSVTALPADVGPDVDGSNVSDLIADGGNVFELEQGEGMYEIDGSGQTGTWVLSSQYDGGDDIALGPDGDVYMTGHAGGVYRFTPGQDGTATELSTPVYEPTDIVAAGGRLFFVDGETSGLDAITTAGQFSSYNVQVETIPHQMTVGPDGDLWAIGAGYDGGPGTTLQRIDPSSGALLGTYSTPHSLYLLSLTAGPDGRLWFPEAGLIHAIGAFDPTTGAFSTYSLPADFDVTAAQPETGSTPELDASTIAPGPDDTLWVTGKTTAGAPAIAEISGIAASSAPTSPSTNPTAASSTRRARLAAHLAARLGAHRTVKVRLACTGRGTCRGRLRLILTRTARRWSLPRTLVIATDRYRLAAGHRRTLRLRISRRGARRIEAAPRRRLTVTLRILPASEHPRAIRTTLSAPKKRARHRD